MTTLTKRRSRGKCCLQTEYSDQQMRFQTQKQWLGCINSNRPYSSSGCSYRQVITSAMQIRLDKSQAKWDSPTTTHSNDLTVDHDIPVLDRVGKRCNVHSSHTGNRSDSAAAPLKHLQLIGALPKPGNSSAFTIRSQCHVICLTRYHDCTSV